MLKIIWDSDLNFCDVCCGSGICLRFHFIYVVLLSFVLFYFCSWMFCPSIMSFFADMFLHELCGNLFDSSDSLAHCVSSDLKMSRGIAVQFKKHFPEFKNLDMKQGIGGVIVLRAGSRFVFNLVTKMKFYEKPQYLGVQLCLENLRLKLILLGVPRLSIPHLACGLDGLSWVKVMSMIKNVLGTISNLCVTVYSISSPWVRYNPIFDWTTSSFIFQNEGQHKVSWSYI